VEDYDSLRKAGVLYPEYYGKASNKAGLKHVITSEWT